MSSNRTAAVSLVVVDDHPVVGRGVELLVEATPDMDVVGLAQDRSEAVAVVESCQPQVVLVDLCLKDGTGLDVARAIQKVSPLSKIVIFTAHSDHTVLHQPMPSNIFGVVLKDTDSVDLISILRRVAQGEDVLDQRVSSRLGQRSRVALTARELDVLRLLSTGGTNREIALNLGVAPSTVKTYVRFLFQKLGARNRLEAVMRAQAEGLL